MSFSNADKATIGFMVEPGEYNPATVLFIKGFKYPNYKIIQYNTLN